VVSTILSTWIACAPGLEQLVAAELKALGLSPKGIEPGGMTAAMSPAQLYEANLRLTMANRVAVRIGKFHASEFWELEKRAERLDPEGERGPVPGDEPKVEALSQRRHRRAIRRPDQREGPWDVRCRTSG
jgi:hypothetical protein